MVLLYKKASSRFIKVLMFIEYIEAVIEEERSKIVNIRTYKINLP